LDKIDQAKQGILALSEAEVKAFIMNELFIRGLFYNCFKTARDQQQLEE